MTRRSLMLAGGGLKIAFQAGVLQVWLDEAGLQFDHADGVSAACFNVAMWAQGMSGRQIADNWRNLKPLQGVAVNWSLKSFFTLDKYRRKVFPRWGLDFAKIRAAGREATFNVYNVSRHELRPVPSAELTEDLLVATGSLPVWFPPVQIGGETWIDAIFHLPANMEEAIRRGADELWVIWTTSRAGRWKPRFTGNFFSLFEAVTNHRYQELLARIARNNDAVRTGAPAEFGRTITVRELAAEVPLHYLFNFSRRRIAAAVELGVRAGREWMASELGTL